jgi:hypothetical protein
MKNAESARIIIFANEFDWKKSRAKSADRIKYEIGGF